MMVNSPKKTSATVFINVLTFFSAWNTEGRALAADKGKAASAQTARKNVGMKKKGGGGPTKNRALKKTMDIDTTCLQRLECRILALRQDRQRLEQQKYDFLKELTQKQAAFASLFPVSDETKHQQSLLLALSSRCLDDFVHGSVMLNYLQLCRLQQNQEYLNLVRNLNRTQFLLRSGWKIEQDLLEQWRKEKERIDALYRSHGP